jgi:uncharacterized protein YndB with AHSA1/START domain
MKTYPSRTLGAVIARPVERVYGFLAAPDNFQGWASAG